MNTPRTQARYGFEIPVRVTLVENDLDEVDKQHDRLSDEIASVKKVLVGILVSLTTSAVLLAINLVVSR